MKHFKDINNQVYAYESDGSQDAYIKASLVAITDAEADDLRKPPPPTKEQINADTFARLALIDLKSIRALREGDATRLASLEVQAVAERGKLVK